MSGASRELTGSMLLRAGAGAGKTSTLVQTLLDFARQHRQKNGDLPSVIITTFTRKATQELKERLLRKAAELARQSREQGNEPLATEYEQIFAWLGQRSRVHISTIHGVLNLFLSRFANVAGFPTDYSIAADSETRRLRRRILRDALLSDPSLTALLEEYSFNELLEGVQTWHEARATHGELRRWTQQAMAAEALTKILPLFAEGPSLARQIRDSSSAAAWLRWADFFESLQPLPRLEHLDLILPALRERREEVGRRPSLEIRGKAQVDAVVGARALELSEILNEMVKGKLAHTFEPQFWQRHEELSQSFERLAMAYSERWRQQQTDDGVLSMGDLETLSLEILRQRPETGGVFAQEWDYWMIDEYQDTSPVQVQLLRHLIGDRPHFVVGDPQQSIYSFRGARSEVFMEKYVQMQAAGHPVETRTRNHRSQAPLLSFFNAFFAEREGFGSMEAFLSAAEPAAPVAVIRPLEPRLDANGKTLRGECSIQAVLERVAILLQQGTAPEQICVLARKNGVLKEILEAARPLGIPMQLHSSQGFSARREVRDVGAFLKFLVNPWDVLSLLTLLRSPWFRLPDAEIHELCMGPAKPWAKAMALMNSLDENHPLSRLQGWRQVSNERGLVAALRLFYQREGLLDRSDRIDPSGRREANLWKLLGQLEESQRTPGFNLLSFLESLGQSVSVDDVEGDAVPAVEPSRVNLMTVHASKGLEFEHVILTHMDRVGDETDPRLLMVDEKTGDWSLQIKNSEGKSQATAHAWGLTEILRERERQESLRVLYVAMTRAKKTVTLIWEKDAKGEVRRQSWAAALPLPSLPGTHQRDDFTYLVDENSPVVTPLNLAVTDESVLREPWAGSTVTGLERVSPTTLLDRHAPQAQRGPVREVDLAQGLKTAQRGTDAHRLFEALKYASPERVAALTDDEEFRQALQWVENCAQPPLMSLITHGHVEWGFAVKTADFVLQGQIDLWGVVDSTLWIVDYKTGSSRQSEKAMDQMVIYAWALRRMRRWPIGLKLCLAAVYPLEEKVITRSYNNADLLMKEWQRWSLKDMTAEMIESMVAEKKTPDLVDRALVDSL